MAKIRIDAGLLERVKNIIGKAGYGSAEEFIAHVVEKELYNLEAADNNEDVADRLKGLGYLE